MTAATRSACKDPRLAVPPALDQPDWTTTLQHLDAAAADRLLLVLRTLFPHDGLPDPVYRRVVAVFDRLAVQTPQVAAWIAELGAALEAAQPVPFITRSEGFRVQALRSVEHTPGFRFIQRTAVRHLYDDVEVWQAFGYEGASSHLGGYLHRGFDDLDWLPPVPADDGSVR